MHTASVNTIESIAVPQTIEEVEDAATREIVRITFWRRFKDCLPSRRKIFMTVSQILILIMICGTVWGMLKHEHLPVAKIFELILLAVTAVVFGKIFRMMNLPPLAGMIIAGFLFRNIGLMDFNDDFSHKSSAILRNMSLVVILLRAGLGLCPDTLKKMKMLIFRMSMIPSLVEAGISAVCTHFFIGLPWIWAMMLGFLLCAVSPAIIVPCFLQIIDRRLGTNKGIPTMVIAVASIDDIIAITGFGIFFGIQFSNGSFAWTLVKGPLEVLVGIAYGSVLGVVSWYLPHIENEKQIYYRVLLLLFGGLSVTFVSSALQFSGAGAVGCVSLAFVAGLDWRHDEEQFPTICTSIAVAWHFFQPFLFSLIGREIDIEQVKNEAGLGILSILVGLFFRMLVTPFVVWGGNFNIKEKVFLAITALPKATVQAALGSVALDLARMNNYSDEFIVYSIKILTLAVLSILLTAPIGAALISLTAPLLLERSPKPTDEVAILKKDEIHSYVDMTDSIRSQVSINTL